MNWSFKGVSDLWYFWSNINVFGRRILASHTGLLSMAEPPNLVLQVNVSRSTLLVCIILFMYVCVCVRREPGNEASIQL